MSDLFDKMPAEVSVYEVSPRDGLQNERVTVQFGDKLRLIDAICAAGVKRVEITSFVSPKWIPQLADADEVAEHATAPPGVEFSALVPNAHGLERARATGMKEVAVFISASETHNRKNVNKSIELTMKAFADTIGPAIALGMKVRGYVSTVWGCPYEGSVDPRRTLDIAKRLHAMGCYQISISDTIGVGTPRQTSEILKLVLAELPSESIAMHMHDTRGSALANILVGLELGIRTFDASLGGLGGCPYAPGAAGNVATEDLVYMLQGMGIGTGIDLDRLVEAGRVASSIVGRVLPSKVQNAGVRSLRT